MKKKYLSGILLLFCLQLSAQGKILGHVYYQNSGWKPVEGVLVNAEGSNGDYSKTEGDFLLVFSNYGVGKVVQPYIGENNFALDKRGVEMELVNERELEYVIIPENPNDAPLSIIVAKKGLRELAARKYYGIIKNQVEIELDEKRKEVIALAKKLGAANKLVAEKNRELSVLRTLADSVSLYKEALRIASINRDGAKDRIKNYLDALDAGISIEEARKELSSKKAYNEAINGMANLKSSIQELRVIAKNYETQFRFEEAFNQYDTIAKILKNNLINPLILVDNYMSAGYLANNLNRHNKAKTFYNLALETIAQTEIGTNIMTSLVLFELGKTYAFLYNNDKAEDFLIKSLEIYSFNQGKVNKVLLGKIYANLGYVHMRQEKHIEAKKNFLKALEILTPEINNQFEDTRIELVSIYAKLSALYVLNKELPEAEKMLYQATIILTQLKKKSPQKYVALEAQLLSYLGNLLMTQGNPDKAKIALLKAQEMEKGLSKDNPQRYNLQFAQTLQFLTVIAISETMQAPTKELRDQYAKEGLELTGLIEKVLSVYPANLPMKRNLIESNRQFKNYFTDDKEDWSMINKDPFIALINLDKKIQRIEEDIRLTNNSMQVLEYRRTIFNETQKVYLEFPDDENMFNYLLQAYCKNRS